MNLYSNIDLNEQILISISENNNKNEDYENKVENIRKVLQFRKIFG